jgi:hypothetical protein
MSSKQKQGLQLLRNTSQNPDHYEILRFRVFISFIAGGMSPVEMLPTH